MPKYESISSLAELLKRSREIRLRLEAHCAHAAELKKSVERSKKHVTAHARFSPE